MKDKWDDIFNDNVSFNEPRLVVREKDVNLHDFDECERFAKLQIWHSEQKRKFRELEEKLNADKYKKMWERKRIWDHLHCEGYMKTGCQCRYCLMNYEQLKEELEL